MTSPVNRLRPRRSCLAVPGSNPRFLEKAQGLPADQVFLDLEDACAPLAKPEARHTIVKFLNEGDWTGKTRVVRVNDWTTDGRTAMSSRSSRVRAPTSTASCCRRSRTPSRWSRWTCS